jgi:hypothetical protein
MGHARAFSHKESVMINLPNDSAVPGAASPELEPQAESMQPDASQGEAGQSGSCALEEFNLDDIEVIESKVFA